MVSPAMRTTSLKRSVSASSARLRLSSPVFAPGTPDLQPTGSEEQTPSPASRASRKASDGAPSMLAPLA